MANRILHEYKDACTLPALSSAPSLTTWQAPPSSFIKINTDGAASYGSPSCTGMAIRNCRGCLIAASRKVLPSTFSSEVTEALALQDGVLLALELGISQVIVESDALSIIQAINEGVSGGELGHIVQNIKDISSSFSWCSFLHLNRSGNRAAHELARVPRDSGVTQFWKGVCPSFVEAYYLKGWLCVAVVVCSPCCCFVIFVIALSLMLVFPCIFLIKKKTNMSSNPLSSNYQIINNDKNKIK